MTSASAPPFPTDRPTTGGGSDAVALSIAAIGHVGLLALLSLTLLSQPEPLTPPSPPITVMLSDEIGLESGAPVLAEAPTAMAPELGEPEPLAAEIAPPPPQRIPPTPPPARRESRRAATPPVPPQRTAPPREQTPPPRASRLSDSLLDGISDSASTSREANAAPADAITPQVQASLQQAVTRQLRPHWTPPSGADAEQLRTTVRFRLDRSGNLIGSPQVLGTRGQTASNSPQVSVHQRRAVAAVRAAVPFSLPERYYEEWREIEYDFRASI